MTVDHIQENTFYKTLLDSDPQATLAEKKAATVKAMTFDAHQSPAKNQERLKELEPLTEFLQSEQMRCTMDMIELCDFNSFDLAAEVYTAVKEFDSSVKEIADSMKPNVDGVARDEARKRLLGSARELLKVSNKVTSDTLPRLADERAHIDSMLHTNKSLISIYDFLNEASAKASAKSAGRFHLRHKDERREHAAALGSYKADFIEIRQNLEEQADKLETIVDVNLQNTAEIRKLAGRTANQVTEAVSTIMIASAEFNKASAAAQETARQIATGNFVLPDELQEAIAVLNDASTEKKPARSRSSARPQP